MQQRVSTRPWQRHLKGAEGRHRSTYAIGHDDAGARHEKMPLHRSDKRDCASRDPWPVERLRVLAADLGVRGRAHTGADKPVLAIGAKCLCRGCVDCRPECSEGRKSEDLNVHTEQSGEPRIRLV